MGSLVNQIRAALIAYLNAEIRRDRGYAHDLARELGGGGAQKIRSDHQPGTRFPRVELDLWAENPAETEFASKLDKTGEVHIQPFVEDPPEEEDRSDAISALCADVQRALGRARLADPILGVTGLQDITDLGYTIMPSDAEQQNTAIMRVQVHYGHDLTDPGVAAP